MKKVYTCSVCRADFTLERPVRKGDWTECPNCDSVLTFMDSGLDFQDAWRIGAIAGAIHGFW